MGAAGGPLLRGGASTPNAHPFSAAASPASTASGRESAPSSWRRSWVVRRTSPPGIMLTACGGVAGSASAPASYRVVVGAEHELSAIELSAPSLAGQEIWVGGTVEMSQPPPPARARFGSPSTAAWSPGSCCLPTESPRCISASAFRYASYSTATTPADTSPPATETSSSTAEY